MTVRDLFERIDSDIEVVIARFGGNQSLLDRFVRKFPEDPNFESLKNAVIEENIDKIECGAHTIKGLAANLGFTHLSTISAEMVTAVRQKRYDLLGSLFELLEAEYKKIVECIKELG